MKKDNEVLVDGPERVTTTQRRLISIRYLFLVCLIGFLGYYIYESVELVSTLNDRLLKDEFQSIGSIFEQNIQQKVIKSARRLEVNSIVLATHCPADENFPNCSYPLAPYVSYNTLLVANGDMRAMGFAPFVRADQVSSFESYVYSMYETQGFPTLGIHKFGKGIMAVDSTSGVEYHDTTGSVLGKRSMLVPVLEAAPIKSNNRSFMYNLYSEASRIAAIDRMLDCFEESVAGTDCTVMTSGAHLFQQDSREEVRPVVFVLNPLVPLHSTNATGLVFAAHNWDALLQSSLPVSVPTVDIVLQEHKNKYTFR
jgi:hypothetical protein